MGRVDLKKGSNLMNPNEPDQNPILGLVGPMGLNSGQVGSGWSSATKNWVNSGRVGPGSFGRTSILIQKQSFNYLLLFVNYLSFRNDFLLQTDKDPNTVLTLQAFEIIAQHEDFGENRPNVLTLTNGPAQVKISWKDFKDYNYVIDVSRKYVLHKLYAVFLISFVENHLK